LRHRWNPTQAQERGTEQPQQAQEWEPVPERAPQPEPVPVPVPQPPQSVPPGGRQRERAPGRCRRGGRGHQWQRVRCLGQSALGAWWV